MIERTSKNFLTEALIISVSNLLVKIIGVVFKIPMSNLLQESMGIFNAAYSIYAMLYMVSTSGLPVAISRLIASSDSKGRGREVKRTYMLGTLLFGLVGIACFLFLFFASDAIAVFSEHPDAALAMKVISPTLFFVCLSASVRGYFQGLRNMFPTALSQFIEAFFKMAIGIAGAYYAGRQGYGPIVQAAFGISGLTAGTMLSTLFLLFCKRRADRHPKLYTEYYSESNDLILKRLIRIALPVTITSSALYFSQFLDTLVINKCLIASGVAASTAEQLYASYTTLSLSLSDILPSTLVYPIAISILPAVSAALTDGDNRRANRLIHSSVRISGIIALPCGFGLAAVARCAIALIYGSEWGSPILLDGKQYMPIDIATNALIILSAGIFFIALLSTTNALLQACRKSQLPMVSVCVGVVFLVITEVSLVSVPAVGIYGAPIATLVCYLVALLLNLMFLRKQRSYRKSLIVLFGKPFLCSLACGASAFGTVRLLDSFLTTPGIPLSRLNAGIELAAAAAVGVIVYAVLMLIFRGITKNEILLLPYGRTISSFLERKKLL